MFKKIFRKIKKVIKPVGKAFKKVMKPFAKIQQKLGPVGTMALMFIAPYALPAIWGAFGAWAGMGAAGAAGASAGFKAMSAGMQTLMKGIYTAGAKIGAAYNTVTGFISDTVGKIAGNTIGKIPVGAEGKTVGSIWKNFTDNLSMKMTGRDLKIGKGIDKSFEVATGKVDFVNDALSKIKGGGFISEPLSMAEQVRQGVDSFMPKLSSGVLPSQATSTLPMVNLPSQSPLVSNPFSNLSLNSSPVISGDYDITGLVNAKTDPSLLGKSFDDDPFVDVITSLKREDVLVDAKYGSGKNATLTKERLDSLVPTTTRVRQSVLNANPEILAEAELLQGYVNDVNGFSGQFIDTGIKYEPTKIAKARMIKEGEKLVDVAGALTGAVGMETPEQEAARLAQENAIAQSYARDALALAPMSYSGLQDFSSDFSNLSSTYSAAGYGPQTSFTTPQSQYEAGAYGGAGFMNQVSSRFLQPTIGMPKLA